MTALAPSAASTIDSLTPPLRVATPRRYLMCRPTYFDVVYTINPWMDPRVAVDHERVMSQWENLRQTYLSLGHQVEVIDVFKEPARALEEGIFMTPTLIKRLPLPVRRIVGTLSEPEAIREALGIEGDGHESE